MKKKTGYKDIEIETREYNGHLISIAEDRCMMEEDGTSHQYIIYLIKNGKRKDKCYITGVGVKRLGFTNVKEFARHIFNNPYQYKKILGCNWRGYKKTIKEYDIAV